MAAFGLGKLPFFSSRNRDALKDATLEDSSPAPAIKSVPRPQESRDVDRGRHAAAASPKSGKRENQIDGQAIRRPGPEASALTGGFLSFAGHRDQYIASEPKKGNFVIRHTVSGRETSISGVDYIQFADLTVSCDYLTRSNPDTLVLPTPASGPSSQGNILELAQEVATAIDEGLLSPAADAAAPAAGSIGHGAITVTEAELLAGAGDDAGDSIKITDITCAQEGSLENNGDGSWTFQPEGDFSGEIALQLTIVDGAGEESSVDAIITIEAEDGDSEAADPKDAPSETAAEPGTGEIETAKKDDSPAAETASEEPASIGQDPELASGKSISEASSEAGMPGTAPASPPKALSPITSDDSEEASAAEETKEPTTAQPAVQDPSAAMPAASESDPKAAPADGKQEQAGVAEDEDKSLTVKVSELIGCGDEIEGEGLRLHGFTQPSNGCLVDNGDGTLSFTPDPDWDRSTTFEYTMIDNSGHTTIGTAIVELDPLETEQDPEPPTEIAAASAAETADEIPVDHAELYAGMRYEDAEVDDEDSLVAGPGSESGGSAGDEDRKANGAGPTYADAWAGSLGSESLLEERPEDAGPKTGKKPSANAEAAAELFKKLDW